MASHQDKVVIDIYGEGKTDVGTEQTQLLPGVPDQGVIPILVHRLCGEPAAMRVRRFGRPFQMKKGGLQEKSRLARMQSRDRKADGLVFVVDADGGDAERAAKRGKLAAGGDQVPDGPPMAVGVAQPCIEAWLLAAVWSRSSDSCRVVPESSLAAAVPGAATGIAPSSGRCMTWAMRSLNDRGRSISPTPSITAPKRLKPYTPPVAVRPHNPLQ